MGDEAERNLVLLGSVWNGSKLGGLNFFFHTNCDSHCVADGKYKVGVYGIVLDFEISLVCSIKGNSSYLFDMLYAM